MKKRLQIKTMIFLVAFLFSAFFAFGFRHTLHGDDDSQYDAIGWNIAEGNGFSMSTAAPFMPTMNREPAYPYFLGCIYKVFGRNHTIIRFIQVVLFGLTCLVVFDLTADVFDEKISKYAAFLTAISPPLANYASYILSECLFTFLLCLSIFLLTRAVSRDRAIWFFAAGAILGLAVLCKSVMLPFFVIASAGIIIIWRRQKVSATRKALLFLVFSFAFFAAVMPWGYRNYHVFGMPQVSLRGGNAVWVAGDKMNYTAQNMKREVVFNFSEYLGNKLFPGTVEKPEDFILWESKKSHEKEMDLLSLGYTHIEIDRMMRNEGMRNIGAHPFKFLAHIPIEFIKMTAFIYLPELNKPSTIKSFYGFKHGRIILSLLRGVLRLSAYPILIFAVIGVFMTRALWRKWYFACALIIYINAVYSMLFALGRYSVPLLPFYMMFASAGLFGLLDKGRRKQWPIR